MGTFFIIVVFVVGFIVIFAVSKAEEFARELAEAKATYHASLEKLSDDPTNPSLRKTTLEFGRVYSNLTRKKQGVSLFDEVALMNDINAACGGTTAISNSGNPPTPPDASLSIQERLTKLRELKEQGFVSELEYEAKRQQLISEV
jgi:hypothetical protein